MPTDNHISTIVRPDVIETSGKAPKLDLTELMMKFRDFRIRGFTEKGLPQAPVDRVPAWVIPQATYVFGDTKEDARIEKALKAIDPTFRLIYDPLTAPQGMPAYHVYTIMENGWPGGHDLLVHEFGVQTDISAKWLEGRPVRPGWWLVEKVKSVYKGYHTGDRDRIHRDTMMKINDRIIASQVRQEANDKHYEDWIFKDIWEPQILRGRVGTSMGYTGNVSLQGVYK